VGSYHSILCNFIYRTVSVCQLDKDLPLLQCHKILLGREKALIEEHDEQLRKLRELKRAEKILCDTLSEKQCAMPDGKVPSSKQVAQLQESILRLEDMKVRYFHVPNSSDSLPLTMRLWFWVCPFVSRITEENHEWFLVKFFGGIGQ